MVVASVELDTGALPDQYAKVSGFEAVLVVPLAPPVRDPPVNAVKLAGVTETLPPVPGFFAANVMSFVAGELAVTVSTAPVVVLLVTAVAMFVATADPAK